MQLVFVVQQDLHRHALGQAHPLQVAVDRRQPFAVHGAAAVIDGGSHAVDGAMHDTVTAQRGNFRTIAFVQTMQLGFFQIGQNIETVFLHQRHSD
ncbi:hypothetical protein D3C86_1906470 [compost metagenome]